MQRRNFLAFLSTLPLVGWAKPKSLTAPEPLPTCTVFTGFNIASEAGDSLVMEWFYVDSDGVWRHLSDDVANLPSLVDGRLC